MTANVYVTLALSVLGRNRPVRAPGRCALDSILISTPHTLFACLYRMLPHHFLHFFLTCLLPCLSFPLRIDPLCFQAGCRKRRLNLALAFFVYFVLSYISFDWRMSVFVALGLPYQARRLACEKVSEMTCFVSTGT